MSTRRAAGANDAGDVEMAPQTTDDILASLENAHSIRASMVVEQGNNEPVAADRQSTIDPEAVSVNLRRNVTSSSLDFASDGGGGAVNDAPPSDEADMDLPVSDNDPWKRIRDESIARQRRFALLVFGGFLAFAAALTLIVVISLSYVPVERQHLALRWNTYGAVDTAEVHGNGHHFWGPQYEAIAYPSTWRRVCFGRDELEIAVASGQVLTMSACFRYEIRRGDVASIFRAYGQAEERAIRAVALGAIKNAAPNFTFAEYVTARENVTAGLAAAIVDGLAAAGVSVRVPLVGFVLGFVELPESVLALSEQVFEATELQIRQRFERDARVVRLATQANATRTRALAAEARAAADATRARLQEAAAHRGTGRLRAETGALLQALGQRLGVGTQAGTAALARYLLVLASLEGDSVKVSASSGAAAAAEQAPFGRLTALDGVGGGVVPEL